MNDGAAKDTRIITPAEPKTLSEDRFFRLLLLPAAGGHGRMIRIEDRTRGAAVEIPIELATDMAVDILGERVGRTLSVGQMLYETVEQLRRMERGE